MAGLSFAPLAVCLLAFYLYLHHPTALSEFLSRSALKDSSRMMTIAEVSIAAEIVLLSYDTKYWIPIQFSAFNVIQALQQAETSHKPGLKRIAVGYNSNLDLIVHNAPQMLESFRQDLSLCLSALISKPRVFVSPE